MGSYDPWLVVNAFFCLTSDFKVLLRCVLFRGFTPFVAKYHSSLSQRMDRPHFVHLTFDGHLGHAHLLASVNICVCILVWIYAFIFRYQSLSLLLQQMLDLNNLREGAILAHGLRVQFIMVGKHAGEWLSFFFLVQCVTTGHGMVLLSQTGPRAPPK